MDRLPDAKDAAFGAFAPDRTAERMLGTQTFDQAHRSWFGRRKLGKYWLRKSERIFDLTYRGFKLRLHPATNVGDEGIVLNGIHGEEDEFQRVAERVAQYENFIDIGANIGLYSLIAAKAMPAGRPIIAFEPDPDTVSRLKTHLSFNAAERVQVVQAAVSEVAGSLRLFQPPHNIGGTSANKRFEDWTPFDVPCVVLKDELAQLGIVKIGMLKVDIEGFEDRALMPFIDETPMESWPRYILIEVCHGKHWKRDVVTELEAKGYRRVFQNVRNIHFELGARGAA